MTNTSSADPVSALKRTPLYDLHVAKGARLVPFAGYEMPVQYEAGVLKEHLHTREAAGLFDVSHMGQIVVRAKSGNMADAALALERVTPVDVLSIEPNRQRYAFFTNEKGGILDDLMIANRGDHYLLVVNAACKDADEALLRDNISDVCTIARLDRGLVALQGPQSETALARLVPACADMTFMDVEEHSILGSTCIIARAGYTGEDGFEISLPLDTAAAITEALLADPLVEPVGLGARDSLRLEAGLCLYGSDIDQTTTPIEAALVWGIQEARRANGARAGGFLGADVILDQMANGTSRTRVGLRAEGRAPVRAGAPLFAAAEGGEPIGTVTSGGFGPSVDHPVAMGYVPPAFAKPDTQVFAEIRGRRQPMTVARLPFVKARFKRGKSRHA